MTDNRTADGIRASGRSATWLPVLLFLAVSTGMLVLWREQQAVEQRRLSLETQVTAEQVRLRLAAWIDTRANLTRGVADLIAMEAPQDSTRFVEFASRIYDLGAGMQAVNFIDTGHVIRIVVPEASNQSALGIDLDLHPSPGVQAAILMAESTRASTCTPVIDLLQGGKGFATYHPIFSDGGRLMGYVNGVFKIDVLVDACLAEPNLRSRFRMDLTDDRKGVAYRDAGQDDPREWRYASSGTVHIVNRDWMLTLAPLPQFAQNTISTAQYAMAAGGLLLALVLALTLRALLLRHAALQASRSAYQLLVDNLSDMLVKVDTSGRFLYVSPSYCRMFGMQEMELIGQEIMPLVHEDDRESTSRALERLHEPPHTSTHEQRALTRDGWRWIGWSNSAVLGDDGRVKEIVAVGRDITRRRELEEQLALSQKMQAVGQLAGGIAHDFNNILQAMRSHLHFVDEAFAAGTPEKDDVHQIERSIQRAATLTRQLLAFSRQQVLHTEDLDLNHAVTDMLKLIGRVIGEDVVLAFRPEPELRSIHADLGQVEQILLNLCVNARDAIDGAGSITISTANRDVDAAFCEANSWARPGRWVELTVRDDGRGMDPETQRRIFDPFFTTKKMGHGTGLGLATVYGIVRQHDGLVRVESKPGHGSTFSIWLPAGGKAAPRPDRVDPGVVPRGRETVLVAEDDEAVRELATRVLVHGGYKVITARDGEEAVRLHAERRGEIALVILDVVMPKLGGREARARILEQAPNVRILFATGYDPDTIHGRLDDVRGADILSKPYEPDDLLRRVRKAIDG
jgi:PAS domain S-box-containing protein